jgi:hypothetical protein
MISFASNLRINLENITLCMCTQQNVNKIEIDDEKKSYYVTC